ncbi:S41 family peptidase [Polluticoccus soli]|uniref:S41 family peptidase n=1 Tax=Polluticoccus soli TaxID=3034150 RepID=UPI0023E2533E|nr:S41 family peptidase [Flavipsychrobacter sp. JY13-12]
MKFDNIKAGLKRVKGFSIGVVSAVVIMLFLQAKTTDSYFEISKNLDIFTTIFKELNTFYVDPIEPGKLVKTGIDAMLEDLDPYTNYITESDIEEYEFQTTGKYGGIGATMRKKDDAIIVGDVHEAGPAQKAGVHPGDQLLMIDSHVIKGKNTDDISVLLKGSPGTQVSLKVKDAYTGQESVKIVTRGEIEVSSVPFAGLVGPANNIAYVRLTQFTPGCSRLVRSALDSLKKAQPNLKGVVMDLRNNPGGLLDEAVSICNLFVDRGQLVVSTKGKMPEWDKDFNTMGAPWDTKIPLTVLVNSSSASASEIVAGTTQDLDRGVVIGERSYGKGLVQVTRPLGYNARLKLTTAKYYTPSGRCIQAVDYASRNPDGSVGKIPDSLKKEFRTKSGRKVLSGGGVEPDVNVEDEPYSKLAIALYTKNYMFDYATQYATTHKTIAPAGAFALSKDDFNEFAKWLGNKDYSYKSETEIALDSLKEVAVREKYFEAMKPEYAAVQNKLTHDKKQDLMKHQDEISRFLENEIISRYYFLRGRIEHSLRSDDDLKKAIALIEQPTQYQALLVPRKAN